MRDLGCLGGAKRQPSNIPPGSTHCGGGRYCKPGLKCASGGKCIERDVVDCGAGKFCAAGTKCAKQNGCLPKDAVDCGPHYCAGGNVCAANRKCVTEAHAKRLRGGGPLDARTAETVRPLALMAQDAYSSGSAASTLGFKGIGGWEAILKKSGKTPTEIAEWHKAGFGASVFAKADAGGGRKVVVAFVGPEPKGLRGSALRDWIKTKWPAQGERPRPYDLALEFTKAVQQQSGKSDRLAVTGFSLGGALAAFVGNLLKLETVTFDAPSSQLTPAAYLGAEGAPDQTNIITAGDPVSDPLADPEILASGGEVKPLPGQTYVIEGADAEDGPHDIRRVIKSIDQAVAGK
jgi:hypothetical protein